MSGKTTFEALREIQEMNHQMTRIHKLGGRDSFLGMMEIFEIILKEEHQKDPNEPKTGMYRFKGMEQYGNCVSPNAVLSCVKRCREELNFTDEEFKKLVDWYKGRGGIDSATLYVFMKVGISNLKTN